jgi:DUF1680 family protein
MKKITTTLFFLLLILQYSSAQNQPLKSFTLSSVRLLESPFYQAQQTDMKYLLELNADRLLAPFLMDAGIPVRAERYGNWENTGLDGHIGGHYLSALSFMYASTGNKEILERLNYMINWLDTCQKKNGNGYVGGVPQGKELWSDIAAGRIDAGTFSLANRWVPLYNLHKLFAGLRDAYLVVGDKKALNILIKLTDWFLNTFKNLTDEQVQKVLQTEHGGINEVFADVSAITGDNKYLELAQRFSHRVILDPLIKGENKLTGLHANTQIPKVVGFKRISDLNGNKDWASASEFFWKTVTGKWTVSIGGNSVREHFHPADNYSSMIESNQGPETCNTYNMLRLTKLLYLSNPEGKYMDYYERSLYNHILSSEHPTKGGFVYFTPMRPRHYRVYSSTQLDFWCCVGSGLENHGKYGEIIYSHNEKDLFVNLFIPSVLGWKERGITLTQQNKFPLEEGTNLTLKLNKSQEFALQIRYPGWVKAGSLKILVNGKEIPVSNTPGSYVAINRKWKNGDAVSVFLPMHAKVEYLPDNSPWASIIYGPLVLAAATDTTDLKGLWADGTRMGHVASGPLYPVEKAPILVTSDKDFASSIEPVKGKPLTFKYNGTMEPESFKGLELVPFYTVHEARYMIYWPVATPQELEKKKQALAEKEREMLALEARTVDQVAPGEQQPESDHNFKGERTETGIHLGRRWRHAQGWFSYDLKNKNSDGKILRITYIGADKGRTFDIKINETLLVTVTNDGSKGNNFFDADYTIPSSILDQIKDGVMTVKFEAHENSMAGGVYYVRLLKE